MKWSTDYAELGETILAERFLWIPMTIGDETRWLVRALYRKKCTMQWHGSYGVRCSWEPIEWIDT